jgi:hypothetical protein
MKWRVIAATSISAAVVASAVVPGRTREGVSIALQGRYFAEPATVRFVVTIEPDDQARRRSAYIPSRSATWPRETTRCARRCSPRPTCAPWQPMKWLSPASVGNRTGFREARSENDAARQNAETRLGSQWVCFSQQASSLLEAARFTSKAGIADPCRVLLIASAPHGRLVGTIRPGLTVPGRAVNGGSGRSGSNTGGPGSHVGRRRSEPIAQSINRRTARGTRAIGAPTAQFLPP